MSSAMRVPVRQQADDDDDDDEEVHVDLNADPLTGTGGSSSGGGGGGGGKGGALLVPGSPGVGGGELGQSRSTLEFEGDSPGLLLHGVEDGAALQRLVCGMPRRVVFCLGGTCGLLVLIALLLGLLAPAVYDVPPRNTNVPKGPSAAVQMCLDMNLPSFEWAGRGNARLANDGNNDPDSILIAHATVWTGINDETKAELKDTDILITGTKIVKIGKGLAAAAPAGTKVIDVQGRVVTPGIVDMHSHTGVYAWPDIWARSDGNEMTDPAFPQARAIDAIDPQDWALPRILEGGVTTSQILPGSGNVMGGEGVLVKNRGKSVRDMYIPGSPRLLKMACGENPKGVYGKDKGVTPMSRMGNAWIMRQKLFAAQQLVQKQNQWCSQVVGGSQQAEPFPTDVALDSLVALLRGDARLNIHCYEVEDLEMAVRVMSEFGVTINAFHHALEAYLASDLMKEIGVTVATFADLWGYKMEAYDASVHGPEILNAAGVPVALKSDHPVTFAGYLMLEAAKAYYYGLPRWASIAALTSVPGNAVGLGSSIGTIEEGKDADLAVWDRDPLLLGSRTCQVLVNGQVLVDKDHPHHTYPSSTERFTAHVQFSGATSCVDDGTGSPDYAVTGATIYTMGAAGTLQNANLIVNNGVVTCVGTAAACPVPNNADVYNVQGGEVTPGFVEGLSYIGLSEIDQDDTTRDGEVQSTNDDTNAAIFAMNGIRMNTRHVQAAHAGGVTVAISSPLGAGLIAGCSVAFKTHGVTVDDAVVHPHAALHVHVGNPTKGSGYLAAISSQIATLHKIFTKANTSTDATPSQRVLKMVLNRQIPLVVHAEQVDLIAAVTRLAKQHNLRLIIAGAGEAHVIADRLAAEDVGVLLFARRFPSNFDTARASTAAANILYAAGVKVALSAGGEGMSRNVRWEAGLVAALGDDTTDATKRVTTERALAMITSNPADMFGLPGVGRIEVGQPANFVAFDGPALTFQGKPVLIGLDTHVMCHPQQR